MAGICLRVILIVVGVTVFAIATVSLAKKHMTESFCVFWGITSLLFIAAGILLQPIGLEKYISWYTLAIVFLGIVCLLTAGFYFSVRISRLMRQVTELAIQVSLLNQENEMLMSRMPDGGRGSERLAAFGGKDEEKNPVYN